jgi:hypothetical protein
MKKWIYISGCVAYFFLIAVPIFVAVISSIYIGFFFYEAYKHIKKVYAKIF